MTIYRRIDGKLHEITVTGAEIAEWRKNEAIDDGLMMVESAYEDGHITKEQFDKLANNKKILEAINEEFMDHCLEDMGGIATSIVKQFAAECGKRE